MNWKKALPASLLIFSIMVAILLVACDKREGDSLSYYIARMEVNPTTIYADNNITYSTVWVYVKDSNGFPVPGERVTFKCSIGTIEAYKDTDSSGVAEALFWDSGEEGEAEIWAFVGDDYKKDYVQIDPAPGIQSINMSVGSTTLQVSNTMDVSATVINALGNPVDDGTIVTFQCTQGYFTDTESADFGTVRMVESSNGIAKVTFNPGTIKGSSTIYARISDKEATKTVAINPGSGVYMDLSAASESIDVGGDVLVTAKVYDRYNNTVRPQTTVNFTADLGNITSSVATDSMGYAVATFSSGYSAGLANITATADSATSTTAITVTSSEVAQIQFVHTGQVTIDVDGTGGSSSVPLQVNLLDQSNNLVSETTTVWFRFADDPPTGANLNDLAFTQADSVGVPAHNGTAIISVNSGTGSGTIKLTAYLYRANDGLKVASTKSNIVVQAGQPNHIDPSIGDYNSGTEYGSGIWRVGISAAVSDTFGNPVVYGTAVWFYVNDPTITWATVNAAGYTGNISVDGDSLQGVAFSYVLYDGGNANDEVPIRFVCGDLSVVASLVLPMNQPSLDMIPVPGHLDWVGNDSSPKVGVVRMSVNDSQGNPIHNCYIELYSTRGLFIAPETQYQTELGYSVVKTNDEGIAEARIQFQEYECPPASPPPNEVPVDVTGVILGTEINDQCTIILLNYKTE